MGKLRFKRAKELAHGHSLVSSSAVWPQSAMSCPLCYTYLALEKVFIESFLDGTGPFPSQGACFQLFVICVRSFFWVQIYVYLLWFSLPGTSGVLSVREDLRSVITANLSGFQPETWHIRVATIYEVPTPFWQCLTQTTHMNLFKSYNRPKRWKLCSSLFHRWCSQLWRTETPAPSAR